MAKGYSYIKTKKEYRISKRINGKTQLYGTTTTEQEAIDFVEALKKCNYQVKQLPLEFKTYLTKPMKKEANKGIVKGYSKNTRDNKYTVRKYINGKTVTFGTVPTEQEAIRYVEALKKCDYNTSLLPEEFKKYVPKRVVGEPKYYHKTPQGTYQVCKRVNGKSQYFGVFPTEELAQQAVKELKEANWNLESYYLNHPQFKYMKKREVDKYLKKSTYNPDIGSLSNPVYNETKINNLNSLSGEYKRKRKREDELFT